MWHLVSSFEERERVIVFNNSFFYQVLEAVGPIIFLSTDTRKLRNEGFLSPFHPRYPDILTNSAHPMVTSQLILFLFKGKFSFWIFSCLQRAQDLANVTSYREWVLFGYLVCPDELLRVTSIDIALVPFSIIFYNYITLFSMRFWVGLHLCMLKLWYFDFLDTLYIYFLVLLSGCAEGKPSTDTVQGWCEFYISVTLELNLFIVVFSW